MTPQEFKNKFQSSYNLKQSLQNKGWDIIRSNINILCIQNDKLPTDYISDVALMDYNKKSLLSEIVGYDPTLVTVFP